ncbi:tyrosine-type recombinase/integrase [Geodermatophilus sp. URMC 61]|uniref:tyrosine-type recombinase/integrase n=1 Tax=Geodermatophilus sp. URMC 61 TaxID=3423411 RepID=UPI00406CD1D2
MGRADRPARAPRAAAQRPHRRGRGGHRDRRSDGLRYAEDTSAPVGGGAPLPSGGPRPPTHRKGADRPGLRLPGRHPAAGPELRRDWFDRAADDAGLSGLTPHELRHTAASLAIASGASVKGVQSMLGHASAQMTLDRYGHLFPGELDAVADRLDAARADQVLTKPRSDAPVARLRRAD